MTAQKYLSDLHHDYKTWKNNLSFYKEDLGLMQKRLQEVAAKNSDKDMHALVERFQNKLIIEEERIDTLQHRLILNEEEVIDNVKANPVSSDHRRMDEPLDLRDDIQSFEVLFNQLRKDLNLFAAKWM
jgi:hypothetical protein